ncbi:MAG: lipoyl synthase [Acidimicrobiales bacterium]
MLRVRRLGRVAYQDAVSFQRALATHGNDEYLLLLEHPHVYTLGVRADPAHVLVDPESVGADLVTTDRGGDVTYHGPGQVVVYPVVSLEEDPGSGPRHVHNLEKVVVRALQRIGVPETVRGIGTLPGYPGVWLGTDSDRPRKVAAIGVKTVRSDSGVKRSLHGVAVNVDCDMKMFSHIVPCGIHEYEVTSLEEEGFKTTFQDVLNALEVESVRLWGGAGVDRGGEKSEHTSDQSVPGSPPGPGPGPDAACATPGQLSVPVAMRGRLRRAGVDADLAKPVSERKPEWLRAPLKIGPQYLATGRTLNGLGLVTVCEEAGCPNIYECWAEGTATFMVNGDRCTRACGFCQVDSRRPLPVDPSEPERIARAVESMNLAHAVVTCVARDDLADGGAGAIAESINAIRSSSPATRIEVLISDCKGDSESLSKIFEARPDVLNHNIETVARLQRLVRPSAGYGRSLSVLARAVDAGLVVKSGLMVGLGEDDDEVVSTLADLANVGVSIATIGQYLRPSSKHLPVVRWWTPSDFARLKSVGVDLGIRHVESSPLTRSSYHARAAAEAV